MIIFLYASASWLLEIASDFWAVEYVRDMLFRKISPVKRCVITKIVFVTIDT